MAKLSDPIADNVTSLLISGGLKQTGQSFILDRKKALLDLKKTRHLRFNAHVGFVKSEEIEQIIKIIDCVSFDFVTDPKVIQRVYKIKKTKQDYIKLYKLLAKKIKVYPHITIGLDGGKIHWEYAAIDELYKLGVKCLVLNVLIPTRQTEFSNIKPPDLAAVRAVIKYCRQVFKPGIVILGCMRPAGRYREELDKIAITELVDRIVQPTPPARQLAEKLGLVISKSYECCVM